MQKAPKHRIDSIDTAILSTLQHNGKISNVQLSQKVGLSESACLRRVKTLEENGILDRYILLVDPRAVGITGNIFVRISLEGQQQSMLDTFEERVARIEEVMECYLLSGDADYMLRVVCKDNENYQAIHTRLTNLPGVRHIHSSFALREVVKKTVLPLAATK